MLKSSSFSFFRRAREPESFLGESSSPFIVEEDGLTTQRKRENVYVCYLVLLPTLSSMRRSSAPTILFMSRCMWQALPCSPGMANVDAYNTVCVLTRMESCIVPIWHAQVAPSCRCAGYGLVWSLVLRFDLSALPYLLRLIPRPSPSGCPRSVVPSRPRPCRSGKSSEQRFCVSLVGEGGQNRTVVPPWLGLPVRDRIVLPTYHYVSGPDLEARVVATPSAGLSFYR